MIAYLRSHLGLKLFLSYLLVILVGVAVIALSTRFTLSGAFNRHMGLGMGQGMMPATVIIRDRVVDIFQGFKASFYEALIFALVAAGAAAILVSLLLSRSILRRVNVLTGASRVLAEGNYSQRVQASGTDELGQLAHSFNEMADKLEQVETMRRQLIGDVSHELRTPLTAIKGSMEGLLDGILPATPETYQQIHQEADRLARLVDDLQELSRVEAGSYSLDLQSVPLASLVHSTLKRFNTTAGEKGVDLQLELQGDLPSVLADPDRITQVLTNLVANALQYTPSGGKVTIQAKRVGEQVFISVADTGIGIPTEHLPHLFTRFYRVDKSRSRQAGGGSGIGLAVARHLVEAHGGRIWAESEGEGKGSTFYLQIPIKHTKAKESSAT